MTNRTASSKVNAWIATAEAAGFEVEVHADPLLDTDRWEEIDVTILAPFGRYVIVAMRYIGDGNRAKAFRHSVSRRHRYGAYEGTAQTLQAREVGYYLALDLADAQDAGRA